MNSSNTYTLQSDPASAEKTAQLSLTLPQSIQEDSLSGLKGSQIAFQKVVNDLKRTVESSSGNFEQNQMVLENLKKDLEQRFQVYQENLDQERAQRKTNFAEVENKMLNIERDHQLLMLELQDIC